MKLRFADRYIFWTSTCCAPLVIALGLIESGSSCVCAKGGQATAAVTGQSEPRGLSASEFPQRLLRAGIENLFRLGTRLYSGGEPEGEAAFAQLQSPGIKILISVDGSEPNIEAAG